MSIFYRPTTSFIGLHNHSQLKLNADQAELYKTEQIEQVYPEYYLIKINNFNDVAKDTLDQWIYFLKNEEVKDNFEAKGLVQAKEVLDYLKYSEEERLEYESYKESLHYQASMYESTYVIGILKGEKKGKMEEKAAIAKKMLQKNIEIAIIAEVTGLTAQEIESISLRTFNIN